MATKPSAALIDLIEKTAAKPLPQDKLDKVKAAVKRLRDLDLEIKDLETRLAEKKAAVLDATRRTLPDLFDDTGISAMRINPEGNIPGYRAELKPYIHASIAKEWEPARKEAALKWLQDEGHGDIIKTVIEMRFGLGEKDTADKVVYSLQKLNVPYSVDLTVPWSTLTAFVKEQLKNGADTPLETLGATVAREVKLKAERGD